MSTINAGAPAGRPADTGESGATWRDEGDGASIGGSAPGAGIPRVIGGDRDGPAVVPGDAPPPPQPLPGAAVPKPDNPRGDDCCNAAACPGGVRYVAVPSSRCIGESAKTVAPPLPKPPPPLALRPFCGDTVQSRGGK